MARISQTSHDPKTSDPCAMRRTATAFDADALQAVAIDQLAQTVDAMAARLRDRPLDAIVDDATDFARRNPVLCLGGAALAGFAVARLLKTAPGVGAEAGLWSGHLTGDVPQGAASGPGGTTRKVPS